MAVFQIDPRAYHGYYGAYGGPHYYPYHHYPYHHYPYHAYPPYWHHPYHYHHPWYHGYPAPHGGHRTEVSSRQD